LLVENSGHLLTKHELMKRLWPETFVEEVHLAQNISAIRRGLDDKNGGAHYIETVAKDVEPCCLP
jgi:DNA-binding winged helix-turn-helix (wHTH) protein